jgi:hypothetical protein
MSRTRRKKSSRQTLGMIPLNAGRDVGELVRAADPETGGVAVHAVNRTQSATDRLLHAGLIDQLHWQAAETLREIWMRARPIADVHAVDPCHIRGGFDTPDPDPVAERALRRYVRALGRRNWVIVERLVYDDQDPRDWGKRLGVDGVKLTKSALDRLAEAMGLVKRASRASVSRW